MSLEVFNKNGWNVRKRLKYQLVLELSFVLKLWNLFVFVGLCTWSFHHGVGLRSWRGEDCLQ
jgi:hypothetical protein